MVPAIVESSLWHSKTPVEFIHESSINRIFLSFLQPARGREFIRERLDHFVDKFNHVSLVDRSKFVQYEPFYEARLIEIT